jgi:hypothetical protein
VAREILLKRNFFDFENKIKIKLNKQNYCFGRSWARSSAGNRAVREGDPGLRLLVLRDFVATLVF